MKCKKSRYWTFLIYPDSAPNNWYDILEQLHIPAAVSPLHNMDVNPDGEIKKAHYHVLLCWDGPTSQSNVQEISNLFSGVLPMTVASVKGMYNYFTHKDNPDKYQYDSKDILTVSGFSIDDYKNYTSDEVQSFKIKIINYIIENRITEYFDLLNNLINIDLELFSFASNNTLLFDRIICSFRHKYGDKGIDK